jgi:hypothetical protein
MRSNPTTQQRKRAHSEKQRNAFLASIAASRLTNEQRACVRKLIAMHPHLSDQSIAKIACVDASAVTHARNS